MSTENKAKGILDKIKEFFNAPIVPPAPSTEPIVVTATAHKLKDGSEISVNGDLAEGSSVMIGESPAEDKEYELEDGTKITVAAGLITAVTPAIPAPITLEDQPAPAPALTSEAVQSMINDAVAPFKQFIETQTQRILAADQKIAKQDEVINGLFELAEKLVEEPAADPVTLTGQKKERFERQNAKADRLNKYTEAIKANKNKVLA